MKKALAPLINYAIGKAKRNKFIQNLFEAPFELHKFPKMGSFQDSRGNNFELLNGLRSKIRPGWESMLKDSTPKISNDQLLKQKENGLIYADKIAPIVKALGKPITNSKILEIGCHSGATSFALANLGAQSVVGTEFSGYKVQAVEMGQETSQGKLNEVNEQLKTMRSSLAPLFKGSEKVSFFDDDICNTSLEKKTFDIICSWEVLEHLHDPQKAFQEISSLLKDDGITIHEYNPFFCLNGGHSLCTLDFLWGHTRLNDADFSKYLDENRPYEKERALSFYRKGLNRMTLHDLNTYLINAGLEVLSIMPFTKEQHLRMIDHATLVQSQVHYPNLTMLDLCAPRVYVIAQKAKK